MRNRKRKRAVLFVCAGLAAVTVCVVCLLAFWQGRSGNGANLALRKGVTATSDSTENEALTAYRAIDGDDSTLSSRWSSENNWEDASHYIQLEFPEEISVSFVVLKWERRNVISYALEGSLDGERWDVLQSFDTAPEMKHQEIALSAAATVRFLRLRTFAVSKNEEDYSNLYQNISLYEFEVYADKPAAYRLEAAKIGGDEAGGRYLVLPTAPEGYEVTFLGADYEQVIGADGTVYPTIQEKEVTVGFLVSSTRDEEDVRETSQTLTVPAAQADIDAAGGGAQGIGADGVNGQSGEADDGGSPDHAADIDDAEVRMAEAQELPANPCPEVIPALAEWQGGSGKLAFSDNFRVVVEEGSNLQDEAALFVQEFSALSGRTPKIVSGRLTDAQAGDLYLGYVEEMQGLGAEGYVCDISDRCVIRAEADTGARWGTVTLLQLLACDGMLPVGRIRDYPRYEVRGFGIDVARKPVSMDTLYAMMKAMSLYKMNDLTVHLNDNVILSTSGLTDSVETAMTAGSAFRLESEMKNEAGQKLTSSEYAYTKEEFAQFIETARTYGVTVVPEIDTPAHSLSLTQLFPEYALTARPESVDQIDLSNREAVELVKTIWQEALSGDGAAFRNAKIVNIGMDEYYGDGEQYRQYLQEIASLVREEGKTVRLWGSLSNMGGGTMPDPEGLQMNIWSTVWADPREMYEAGYHLINMQNNHLYVIPGGGYDYLDAEELYRNWEPNKFYDYKMMEAIPVYSPKMLGAVYMMWNDMCGRLDVGISEYDLYDRFEDPLPVLADRLWGEKTESGYEAFCSRRQRIGQAISDSRPTQDAYRSGIAGTQNRLYDASVGIEPSYEITLRVKLASAPADARDRMGAEKSEVEAAEAEEGLRTDREEEHAAAGREQIIAESDSPYGTWAFYAVEPETGCVGFAREGRTYTWDRKLPYDVWTELKIVGEPGKTTLYVDGVPAGTLGNEKAFEEYATFVFPVERIGKETGAFAGELVIESAG